MRYIKEYSEIGKFYLTMEAYKNVSNLIQEKTNCSIAECNLWVNADHFSEIDKSTKIEDEAIDNFKNLSNLDFSFSSLICCLANFISFSSC